MEVELVLALRDMNDSDDARTFLDEGYGDRVSVSLLLKIEECTCIS